MLAVGQPAAGFRIMVFFSAILAADKNIALGRWQTPKQ